MRCLAALVGCCASLAAAETLVMSAAAPTVPLTVSDAATGEVRQCVLSRAAITGAFGQVREIQVASMTIAVRGCLADPPVVVVLPPAAASTAFSATAYTASLRTSRTYIPVMRTGPLTGSLTVAWSAVGGGVSPASGALAWAAGDGRSKFILLGLNYAPATVALGLPGGQRAVLTVVP